MLNRLEVAGLGVVGLTTLTKKLEDARSRIVGLEDECQVVQARASTFTDSKE
jgi:hypothetical protein